jgi:cytochrome P460
MSDGLPKQNGGISSHGTLLRQLKCQEVAIMSARLIAVAVLLVSLACGISEGLAAESKPAKPVSATDAKGNIHVPEGYRTTFEYIGSWSVASPSAPGAQELHFVYASPGGAEAYKKDGKFPDGTVLVKEVYEATTAAMTTGAAVSHASRLKGWFVLIKDSKGSHPESPLWGDGWGWSWFDAGNSMKTTSTDYHTDCQGCHVPAKGTDWIYVQGYPTLQR